ncbi:hypothetical protein KC887_03530 [Candidatus Kaiserbacteria bacterium]|nr:hypothetical protein [Candidatus Kaiserbacteria bacterium]
MIEPLLLNAGAGAQSDPLSLKTNNAIIYFDGPFGSEEVYLERLNPFNGQWSEVTGSRFSATTEKEIKLYKGGVIRAKTTNNGSAPSITVTIAHIYE